MIINCRQTYHTASINGIEYIHIFKNIYYKIKPEAIKNYYASDRKIFSWANFSYDFEDFAHIKIYISIDKKIQQNIDDFKNNFKQEIINYYNLDKNKIRFISLNEYENYQHFAVINHLNSTMNIEPVKNDWQKGYIWEKKGACTEIAVYLLYNSSLIYLNFMIEYLPLLETRSEAENKHQENVGRIERIIEYLYLK